MGPNVIQYYSIVDYLVLVFLCISVHVTFTFFNNKKPPGDDK